VQHLGGDGPGHRSMSGGTIDSLEHAIRTFAGEVLHRAGDTPTIAVGPLVWGIDRGHDAKHWYFVVGTVDTSGTFHVDQFKIAHDDKELADECRAGLMLEFINRGPVVMQEFNDELRMACFCEAICPCEKTRRIRSSLERERADGIVQ
jgi:hypothetical protein